MTKWSAKWIQASHDTGDVCPVFCRRWKQERPVARARLYVTALGVYEANLNGQTVSYFLAPGWTAYEKRLQYQEYEVTELLGEENTLRIYLGKGWYGSPMPGWVDTEDKHLRTKRQRGILAELHLEYADGTEEILASDAAWAWRPSGILFSEIYDGEQYDATVEQEADEQWDKVCADGITQTAGAGREEVWQRAVEFDGPFETLIPQEGRGLCRGSGLLQGRSCRLRRVRPWWTSARKSPDMWN